MHLGFTLSMIWRRQKRAGFLFFTVFLAIITLAAATERTVHSQASNKELRQKSLQLAQNIRGLVDSYKQWLKDSDLAHDSTMRYYKDHYWADAILLIGELNRRLSKRAKQPELLRLYQHPTNVLGLAAIADHLELHSKLLPD
jgi:hypothetical protein